MRHIVLTASARRNLSNIVEMMTEKAFAKGSAFPVLESGKLRLYSMRFCPYAQRTRLVLEAKKIPYETVNVNLKEKPDWFWERNPMGLVPVLEKDGKILYESAVTCEYLEDVYPTPRLSPADPYQRARDRMLGETFSEVTSLYYKVLRSQGSNKDACVAMKKAMDRYEAALKDRGNFFGGASPGMVDFMLWPWFERFPILAMVVPEAAVSESQHPCLAAWMGRMHDTEPVKATAFDVPTHLAFYKSYGEGKPDYDFGL